MTPNWTVPVVLVIAPTFLLLTLSPAFEAKKVAPSSSRRIENNLDDDLISSYECPQRSRDWTLQCLVPLTNFQMSVDLCGTKQKHDEESIQRCVRELYILGKSCPQPSMLDAAKEMMHNKQPPPPPKNIKKRPTEPMFAIPTVAKPLNRFSKQKNAGHSKDLFDL